MASTRLVFRLILAAILVAALATFVAYGDKKKAEKPAPDESDTASLHSTGEIVDCGDYLVMGKKPADHRAIQVKNIDDGLPACFIDDADGQVYLLVDLGGPARTHFQPTDTWLSAGVELDGVVYQRGNLKALTINEVKRTGAFTDREQRRKLNMEPNKKPEVRPDTKLPGTAGGGEIKP